MSIVVNGDPQLGDDRDRGAVLLLVLAVSIVLSLVVLALANFVAADLRYAQVVDARAKRLASAESGIDYAVDRLRLNQTLCATDAASIPVDLNGGSSPGTQLPPPSLNGTDTRISCKRLDGNIADVAGWAVVIADPLSGGTTSRLRVVNDPDPPPEDVVVTIDGPVFLPDPNRIHSESNATFEVVDGDLWYTDTDPAPPPCAPRLPRSALLLLGMDVGPATARGPECTTHAWSELFSVPLFTALPTNVDPPPDDSFPGCRVFSPGRYTTVPNFGSSGNVYFKSGDYHLAFNTEWTINTAQVWIGHPGPLADSELLPNAPCVAARDADYADRLIVPGWRPGATFYFGGTSQMHLKDDGNVEMFARQQGPYMISAQALAGSITSAPLIRTEDFALPTDLVIHGLVWAPDAWFTFDINDPGSKQMLLGGIVVARFLTPRIDQFRFAVRPATSTVDTRILLTSTSTMNGVSTKVEAVVAYRPQAANLDNRVAVTSYRVVD